MSADGLYSLDRIEGDSAVLVEDGGTTVVVPINTLPPVPAAGKIYRYVNGQYVEDTDAEQARRDAVRALQDKLRRRKK